MARPASVVAYGPSLQSPDQDESVDNLGMMIAEAKSEEEDPSDGETDDLPPSTSPPGPQEPMAAQLDGVWSSEHLSPVLELEACNLKQLSTEDHEIVL
jgi:hypothetical protein